MLDKKVNINFETPDLGELDARGYVFCIDGSAVTDQLHIFEAYGKGLNAPNGYFGDNWNAFNDCLLDLQWIEENEIFIVHCELPHLPPEDTIIYLETLQHVMLVWASEKTEKLHQLYPDFVPHRLTIFFHGNWKMWLCPMLAILNQGLHSERPYYDQGIRSLNYILGSSSSKS